MNTEVNYQSMEATAWIETYTGLRFNVFNPLWKDINILDIAHALSMCTRFNGHLKNYYSVSEHCYWAATLVSPENQLAALLHDASEAYLSDIPRPIKGMLPTVKEIDNKVSEAILTKYGVTHIPEEVKIIDRRLCLTEAIKSGMNVDKWHESHDKYPYIDFLKIGYWDWKTARSMFINRFNVLTKGRFRDEHKQTER